MDSPSSVTAATSAKVCGSEAFHLVDLAQEGDGLHRHLVLSGRRGTPLRAVVGALLIEKILSEIRRPKRG
ncbi:hypothetical protein FALCPG4_018531 [Fusarium falciforme]